MLRTELLAARTEMARQIAQKAEAMRTSVHDESMRYEGALGVLAQVRDVVNQTLASNAEDHAKGEDVEACKARRDILVSIQQAFDKLRKQAEDGLAVQRGKALQSDATLDMLEAIFDADIEAAKRLSEAAEDDPEVLNQPLGSHPGPSIATQRRAEAAEGPDPDAD